MSSFAGFTAVTRLGVALARRATTGTDHFGKGFKKREGIGIDQCIERDVMMLKQITSGDDGIGIQERVYKVRTPGCTGTSATETLDEQSTWSNTPCRKE